MEEVVAFTRAVRPSVHLVPVVAVGPAVAVVEMMRLDVVGDEVELEGILQGGVFGAGESRARADARDEQRRRGSTRERHERDS